MVSRLVPVNGTDTHVPRTIGVLVHAGLAIDGVMWRRPTSGYVPKRTG